MGTLNKLSKRSEWIESVSRRMFYKIEISALIYHFCEKSMITHAALKLKLTFAPQFTSIHAIVDSVDCLENCEVILTKFSNSCYYMLSLSLFFVVFINCWVRIILWYIKRHQSFFVPSPDRLVNIWELYHIESHRTLRNGYGVGSPTIGPTSSVRLHISICLHKITEILFYVTLSNQSHSHMPRWFFTLLWRWRWGGIPERNLTASNLHCINLI